MNLNLVGGAPVTGTTGETQQRSMSGPDYTIPAELQETLLDFTVHYLVERPPDIIDFAMDYFRGLQERRLGRGVDHQSEDESMDSEEEYDEPVYIPSGTRRKSVFAEAYNPEDDEGEDVKVVHPKTDEQRTRLQERVKSQLLFRTLDQDQLIEVIDAMFEHKVKAGETVIRQGDDGDYFYVVEEGVYHALINCDDGSMKKVFEYNGEGNFGELALLYNMPRAATVQAQTNGSLWAMDRSTFRKIVLKSAFQKRKMYESFLENVSLLKHLEKYERENIADALVSQAFAKGQDVVKQGDRANGMYFVESGTLVVLKKMGGDAGDEKAVNEVKQGEYFGELALVNHAPRAATVAAKDNVRVAFLDTMAFERLLGPCMDIMKRNTEEYEEQLVRVFGSKAKISSY